MPRKLVTVRHVSTITAIPRADRIAAATVGGWTCVVPVNVFEAGDRAVYFDIDSLLLATDPRFAPLAPKIIGPDGPTSAPDIRVQTIQIRGVLSQGLLLPLADFPDVGFEDILNVGKFEKPAMPLQQTSTSDAPLPEYPDFIPRTNQERVQNLTDVLTEHGTETFEESTKMDGSSMTVFFYLNDANPLANTVPSETRHNGVAVCSRNRILVENHPRSPPLFYATARALNLHETLPKIGRYIALQGELCGSSIQLF
ncbi:hypothetical protein Forpe1208_v001009 [Fusarium oxysporum f. sp. rapae]|uniref:RNA ligase domain-containing protein n=1 Tax=Fusarium oxysporum f. sp. rapae TaxID=485398 RepID=A0A8J5U0R6_FUSOX|nr:hypothetical protein Forpe1208_v001009 [Fusarium oxysporum f. sp. rapae]